ncbi:MAG: selenium-binding family protein [Gemmatimonadaceae bacterium]|nr:selenium-binding family protein [Gemmatimonadaceae bacterium]
MTSRLAVVALFLGAAACATPTPPRPTASSDFLYLWSASTDSAAPDFLAVYDVRDRDGKSPYGALVTTIPIPGRQNWPHHTEHDVAPDGRLFANGFDSGESFVFDVTTPAAPRIASQFGAVNGLMHPHSFWRLPNGNRLATFQMQHDSLGSAPGGLAELTPAGVAVRTGSANKAGVDRRIRPYSAAILPAIDRVVVTTTDMDGKEQTRAVQFWRLSDLSLQHTIELPNGPRGDEGEATAEPRILSDGKTVLVSTFNCGLYLLDGLATAAPSAKLVASFPRKEGTSCAIPIVAGSYYLVTVPAWSAAP